MNILKNLFVGSLTTYILGEIIEKSMTNYDTDINEPIDTVSIIMPSYNEESTVELSAWSIKNQSIISLYPEYFEFILVDSNSTDKTIEFAKPFVDKIIIAPRGKLTSRNIATKEAKGNIIVSVDADTYYPYFWLNTLLKPFNEHKSIIGVKGSTFDYGIPKIPGKIFTLLYTADEMIIHPSKMTGRNCAYYKHGFYLSGFFDENINQLNVSEMVKEEEIKFGNRLAKFGRIMYNIGASCIHLGGWRGGCRLGLEDRQICEKYGIGKDRF